MEIEYQCVIGCTTFIKNTDHGEKATCPNCGTVTFPASISPSTLKNIYENYSNCPNAWYCHEVDQYDRDCEKGIVMPKCFHAIHLRLDKNNEQASSNVISRDFKTSTREPTGSEDE